MVYQDPQTPILVTPAGLETRIHLLHPGGSANGEVFVLDGHVWQEEPYTEESFGIGDNPESEWKGSVDKLSALNRIPCDLRKCRW